MPTRRDEQEKFLREAREKLGLPPKGALDDHESKKWDMSTKLLWLVWMTPALLLALASTDVLPAIGKVFAGL